MIPGSVPQRSAEEVRQLLRAGGLTDPVCLMGERGYYRRTMGDPTRNDRGIYDDAIWVVSPNGVVAFNANVDPSARYRPGLATLQPGIWSYVVDIHGKSKPKPRQYLALVQAADVIVHRDGTEGVAKGARDARGFHLGGGRWRGMFGINVHRGGRSTTSSLGCQTVPPGQWDAFFALVRNEMRRAGVRRVRYLLRDGAG